jgi:hypothetical protein
LPAGARYDTVFAVRESVFGQSIASKQVGA